MCQVLYKILPHPFLLLLSSPRHSIGNVYIADEGNSMIRKVTVATGIMSTVAGTGVNGYTGDGAAATSATLNYPFDVALDSSGSLSKTLSSYLDLSPFVV